MRGRITPHQISNFIFKKTKIPLLSKSLDAYSERQRAIANNIANVSTPGYKRISVKFEENLKKALSKKGIKGFQTHEKHLPVGVPGIEELKPKSYIPKDPNLRSGLNNVDIDMEMAEQAKNSIRFAYASELVGRQFRGLKSSIRGESV